VRPADVAGVCRRLYPRGRQVLATAITPRGHARAAGHVSLRVDKSLEFRSVTRLRISRITGTADQRLAFAVLVGSPAKEGVRILSTTHNGPLILVASTGTTIGDRYAGILEEAGYSVVRLFNPSLAAVEALDPAPELIITGIVDERTDSILLCRALRSSPATRGMPIIVITRCDDLQTREQILRAGATAISVEPLPRSLLLRQVRRVFARSTSRMQLARAAAAGP